MIPKITSKITFTGIKINAKANEECKYLYNKVLDVVRENKIPAVFATDHIELPTTTQKILDDLKALSIKYEEFKPIKKE